MEEINSIEGFLEILGELPKKVKIRFKYNTKPEEVVLIGINNITKKISYVDCLGKIYEEIGVYTVFIEGEYTPYTVENIGSIDLYIDDLIFSKDGNNVEIITHVSKHGDKVYFNSKSSESLFKNYTYNDGRPFGKLLSGSEIILNSN